MTPRAPGAEGGGAVRRDLVDEVLPILPDGDAGYDYDPHPDGRPWRKCCGECAFLRSDPQGYGRGGQRELRDLGPDGTFYCLHRVDEGMHRVCASYAAIQRTRTRTATPPTGSAARAGQEEGCEP